MSGGSYSAPRRGGAARPTPGQIDAEIGLAPARRSDREFHFRIEHEASVHPEPLAKDGDQPRHRQAMDRIGHFFLRELAVDQLPTLVFGQAGPFVEA